MDGNLSQAVPIAGVEPWVRIATAWNVLFPCKPIPRDRAIYAQRLAIRTANRWHPHANPAFNLFP